MREIKFRFWSKREKKFVDARVWCGIDGRFDAEYNHESVIVQQYTGLKDSKNNEIYEGDIIQFTRGELKTGTFIIKYWEDTMQYVLDTIIPQREFLQDHDVYNLTERLMVNNIKIIGNIFEGIKNEKIK